LEDARPYLCAFDDCNCADALDYSRAICVAQGLHFEFRVQVETAQTTDQSRSALLYAPEDGSAGDPIEIRAEYTGPAWIMSMQCFLDPPSLHPS
jgi:hypothetical protein